MSALAAVSALAVVLFVALIGWLGWTYDASRDDGARALFDLAMPVAPAVPAVTSGTDVGSAGDTPEGAGAAPPSAPRAADVGSDSEATPSAASDPHATAPPAITAAEPAGRSTAGIDPSAATTPAAEPVETAAPPAATAAADVAPAEALSERAAVPPDEMGQPEWLIEDPEALAAFARVPVPDPGLVSQSPSGPLPVIGADGRLPWQVYARPAPADDGTQRIAIVLWRLGFSRAEAEAAIQLPGVVTLAFEPYSTHLDEWIAKARAAGHEVLIQVPMEPPDYPLSDPGPHTLLTTLPAAANIERLEWLLGRGAGYVGITNFMGARFTSSEEALRPVLVALKQRGLLYLDAQAPRASVATSLAEEIGLPSAFTNLILDAEASRVAIDARLYELERIAKSDGSAVGIGFPYPVTIERLAEWAASLQSKGVRLVPLSAVVNLQKLT